MKLLKFELNVVKIIKENKVKMAYAMEIENYYEILEVPRTATLEDIHNQFKSLALRYHPLRNPTNMATNQLRFGQICEAHDVLSNSKSY